MPGIATLHLSAANPFALESAEWVVLHVKSRQEKALAEELERLRIAHFLPLRRELRYHGKRKAWVESPLFAGYLFLRGAIEQAYKADRTRRVASIIPVADQKQLHRELLNIHLALSTGSMLHPHPRIDRGVRVRLAGGSFKGIEGIVESSESNKLVLQIHTLGRAVCVEIDPNQIELCE